MTEQMNVPKLRFGEFEGKWKKVTLGELMTFKNGINASKEQYGSGVKFINVMDIIENDFITHDRIIGSVNVSDKEFEKNVVEYGDLLFQRSSETREDVGQTNVYLDEANVATFGGFVIRGKKIGEFDSVCLNYLLKTSKARKEITTRSGGSTRYNVGQATLSSVEIFPPSNPKEQQKIASFLSKVDEKIGLLSEKKDKLTEYKRGVMQQLFNGKWHEQDGQLTFTPPTLRFKADDGSEFPDWEEKTLGDVNSITGGGTPSTTDESLWGGNIQWFTPTELKTKYVSVSKRTITDKGLSNSSAKILPKGTVLFSSRATVGDVSITQQECTTNQGFQSFNGKPKKANNEFTYYWISSHKNEFLRRASGSTFLEISKSEIAKVSIYLPSLDEQIKIANFLSAIDQKTHLADSELNKAKEWKKGLLQQMFV